MELSDYKLENEDPSTGKDLNMIMVDVTDQNELREAQRADVKINQKIQYILNKQLPGTEAEDKEIILENEQYTVQDGILFRISGPKKKRSLRVVVPEALKKEILIACHDDPMAGHLGLNKTYSRLQERFIGIGCTLKQRIG